MRANMAPLAPQTSTLMPAISHIAQAAEELALRAADTSRNGVGRDTSADGRKTEDRAKHRKDRAAVRWVLDTPRRIKKSGPEKADWTQVRSLLDKWQGEGVVGVDKVRIACERALEERRSES